MQSTTLPTTGESSATTKEQAQDSTNNDRTLEAQPYTKEHRINPQSKVIADALTSISGYMGKSKDSIDLLVAKDDLFWDKVCLGLTLIVLSTWGVSWINTPYRALWKTTDILGRRIQEDFGDLGHAPRVGDKVNGYTVTSAFGNRKSPCAGCSSFHKGVDFGTPVGVRVYAPFDQTIGESVVIQCRSQEQTGGGGLVAELIVTRTDSVVFYQALHLSQCGEGKGKKTAIAMTGQSGLGTGAHLDLRKAKLPAGTTEFSQIDRKSLEFEAISTYESWWILAGSPPKQNKPKGM